jgi:hypothetical protein
MKKIFLMISLIFLNGFQAKTINDSLYISSHFNPIVFDDCDAWDVLQETDLPVLNLY